MGGLSKPERDQRKVNHKAFPRHAQGPKYPSFRRSPWTLNGAPSSIRHVEFSPDSWVEYIQKVQEIYTACDTNEKNLQELRSVDMRWAVPKRFD